ncbi:hypothetical protein Krac_5462 [Ktedonobacter racemifer DSM 44963]|uniref:Uncharacterized protein n=1 Tax=Ktedonobacter racemifer DSM 44963 TaxID=485913 RepID=D6TW42_KTERA|nr:hypothetical protein Krac_5462 [Ktedonobacter racemifer DSM 44963]
MIIKKIERGRYCKILCVVETMNKEILRKMEEEKHEHTQRDSRRIAQLTFKLK